MAIENLTTYTEVDANNKLIVIASKATGENVGRDEDVYLYKDFGADNLNGLSITFELYVAATSVPTSGPSIAATGGMGLSNAVDDVSGWAATDINVMIGEEVSGFKIWLERGPGSESDVYVGAADTIYYCLLERATDSDTATLKIYSDAARTNLLDTLTISGVGTTTKWRYMYGFVNWNGGYANIEFDGYIQNIELSPATLEGVKPTVTTQAVSDIADTTATGNGNITDLGEANPTAHGVCWNTTGTPTTADDKTDEGAASATGAFTTSITGLTEGTLYYIRAYATNSYGTSYGGEVNFKAGAPGSGELGGVIAVVEERLHYVDAYGDERWIEGTLA